MKEIIISSREAGQRLDRYLGRYLREAPKSFIYRMLRKKNIVLNGKKAAGDEVLAAGDGIRLWLSDETIGKMRGEAACASDPAHDISSALPAENGAGMRVLRYPCTDLDILYEDEHVILINKPAGMLSQKAKPDDVSLCEYLIGYLISSGQIPEESLQTVRPSVCNRLDRNTSGIVCCGKSAAGLAALSELLRTRQVHKYYHALVMGRVRQTQRLEGYIQKDEKRNVSRILPAGNRPGQGESEGKRVCTIIKPLRQLSAAGRDLTLIEAQLVTGRSHQIRASLSAKGHTLVGDVKYASPEDKAYFRRVGRNCQLLHCARMEFPKLEGVLAGLSEKTVEAETPFMDFPE